MYVCVCLCVYNAPAALTSVEMATHIKVLQARKLSAAEAEDFASAAALKKEIAALEIRLEQAKLAGHAHAHLLSQLLLHTLARMRMCTIECAQEHNRAHEERSRSRQAQT